MVITFLHAQEFFDACPEISLLFEVHLVELPTILNAEELSNFRQSFLSSSLEFLEDVLDALNVLNLFILGNLSLLYLAVQHVVILLL